MKKIYLLLLIVFLSSGCVAHTQLYSWDKYSNTLYQYKKDPTDENLQNHKEMLLLIMKNSENKNLRVPPGVYCEYGFLLLKEGKTDEALSYFNLEEKTYPESGILIRNIKSIAKNPTTNESNNSSNDMIRNNIPDTDKKGD